MQPNAPFHLRVESGPGTGQRFPVAGSGLTIGRQPGNGIVLEDGRLSRRHAQLDLGPGGLVVTDLGSANGTRVNGRPLTANQPHPLRPGDTLDLGGGVLCLEGTGLGAAVAPGGVAPAAPSPFGGAPVAAPPPARPSASRLPLVLGGVLAALLLCVCAGVGGVFVLANRGGGGSDSGGGSASGSGGGGGGSSSRQAGQVTGRVLDSRGQPVANARILIIGTTIAGERTEIDATTGADGRYSRRVPDGLYRVAGRAVTRYNGKEYTLLLEPVDGETNRTYDSKPGIVRDFRWKVSGLQPGGKEGEPNDHYGGYLRLQDTVGNEALAIRHQGGTFEITLTPRGPLIDGSTGQPLTRQFRIDDLRYSTPTFSDIPIGAYTATGTVTDTSGAQRPLLFSRPGDQPTPSFNIDWTPATAFGVEFITISLR